ncbi:MAG: class I SAM-dependent methyltransferase [Alphaproteobacteria bacterium]|nr:class I SAM-dependent methyltransferase [Alphaproteobacteria bacterium]MBF0250087.1 class I SAM-dependent methyltransferase [Alphaproteobacteria bacterium]
MSPAPIPPSPERAGENHRHIIQDMFTAVAPRYDLMNDLMSMGIHRLWKRRAVALCAARPGDACVDLGGGTGDIARLLAAGGARVTVCDPSSAMMAEGRRAPSGGLSWVAGTGEQLPFADASLDVVTTSFALRNMTRPQDALTEILRVLKPGGRFVCLEFSQAAGWLRPAYDWYSHHVIPRLGAAVAGRPEAYRYLVDSIREFPDQRLLKAWMTTAGFEKVSYVNLSFGVAAIHRGAKPS